MASGQRMVREIIYYFKSNTPLFFFFLEQELFMKRMKEVGVDGQWGIFSMTIPGEEYIFMVFFFPLSISSGRVGYQCSNFYRFLIQQGIVKDPNYVMDDKGKVHYLFSKGVRRTASRVASGDFPDGSGGGGEGGSERESPPKKRPTKKKR